MPICCLISQLSENSRLINEDWSSESSASTSKIAKYGPSVQRASPPRLSVPYSRLALALQSLVTFCASLLSLLSLLNLVQILSQDSSTKHQGRGNCCSKPVTLSFQNGMIGLSKPTSEHSFLDPGGGPLFDTPTSQRHGEVNNLGTTNFPKWDIHTTSYYVTTYPSTFHQAKHLSTILSVESLLLCS